MDNNVKLEFIARITTSDGKVIERSVEAPEGIPTPDDFDMSSKRGFPESFDAYEQAALKARNQIREDITQEYLAEVSKKRREEDTVKRNCSVESEVGRIPMTVYGMPASALKPNERLWGFSYVLPLLRFCKDMSYRKSCDCLNASLHRKPDVEARHRTVADFVENFGSRIADELKRTADRLLEQFRFDPETALPKEEADLPAAITNPTMPSNRKAALAPQIQQINKEREEDAQIKHPALADKIEPSADKCCYISVDDVGVKHRNDHC